MGTNHLPHGYRKSFSVMGEVKKAVYLAKLSLLNKIKKKQKLIISFYTQYFSYLNFFTGNVLFLGHNLFVMSSPLQ